jgi:uncharacterized membrane protein
MDAELNGLFAATVSFVGGHFLLSSQALRPRLVDLMGETGFRAAYSLAVLATLVWMVTAYRGAPVLAFWTPPPAFAWIPVVVMPVAFVLLVCGVTTPSPTSVGGEHVLADEPGSPARGILSVTRHPFLWGTALWALAHLFVRGDAASVIMMAGVAVLSLGGMHHIDRRRETALGAAWGPVAMTTSLVPFAAVAGGRVKPDWAGIGWWRPVLGLALYLAMLYGHAWIIGVPALSV